MNATISASPPVDPLQPILRRVFLRLIPFLFVCYLFNYIDRVNVGFAKLQMLADLKMSETAYGLGAGIFFLGYVTCGVPSCLMLQRVGARRWVAVMMVSWGLLSTSLLFVTTPAMFYILRLLTGVAEAGFFPGIILYLTRWFPRRHHGRIMTIFLAALPVSGFLGGPVSGWILSRFAEGQAGLASWQWLFLLQGLPTIVLGGLVLVLLDDDIECAAWLEPADKHVLRAAIVDDDRAKPSVAADSFGAVLRNPGVWALGILYFCIQAGVNAISFWLPTIIKSSGTDDPFVIGMMSAVPYLAAAIFMIAMGRSADRRDERRWHLIVPLVIGVAGLAIAALAAKDPIVSLAGMTLATMGAMTGLPMFWPVANGRLSAAAAAGGFALINSIGQTAGFASPYLVGWIKDMTGETRPALYALAAALLIGVLLAGRISRPSPQAAA